MTDQTPQFAETAQDLTALFDAVRVEHVIDVMQPGLLACVCGERLPIVYGDDGQPLYNPAIRHHHEQYAAVAWPVGWRAAMDWLAENKGADGIALAAEMSSRLPSEISTPPAGGGGRG